MKKVVLLLSYSWKFFPVFFLFGLLFLMIGSFDKSFAQEATPGIWQIRSIDTMKTSRDKARAELNNSSYDSEIQSELTAIKHTGANYVAIDTPYDAEFLGYLRRWVNLARTTGLHVWFRGNWSSWEGWFDYPKNMSPEQHIQQNTSFIIGHPDLFADGDIFDPCPECENAGFWPQPDSNMAYGEFIQEQRGATKDAFAKIGKNVYTNFASIIGGRAKDVLDQNTFDALDNVIAIDHYFAKPQSMTDYINYFSENFHTKVLVSEFGAPVPDINGDMTDQQQADFIQSVFEVLYQHHDSVVGVNYYVISGGTTPLLDSDGSARSAYSVVKNYFDPAVMKGRVMNKLGDPLPEVRVKSADGVMGMTTDSAGNYSFVIPPPRSVSLTAGGDSYTTATYEASIQTGGKVQTHDFTVEPVKPDTLYSIRSFLKTLWH